jgi:hypothetical protein
MSISSAHQAQSPRRRLALEALALAAALAFLPELAGVRAGAVLEPQPGWVAVLVLAARYGSGGFFAGLIAAAFAVGIAAAVAGAGLGAAGNRLASGSNLIAFGACLVVSWVGSWHLRRQANLAERLRAFSARAAQAEATAETLHGVVGRLRARADRTSSSLSFLRDAAARLEGTDPVAAAEGAADLALSRTGASAATVEVGMSGFRRLMAVRDARGAEGLAPLALDDADLTVPIRNGIDRLGVIALWGIPGSKLDDATAHDLGIIASWFARSLTAAAARSERTTGHVLRAT